MLADSRMSSRSVSAANGRSRSAGQGRRHAHPVTALKHLEAHVHPVNGAEQIGRQDFLRWPGSTAQAVLEYQYRAAARERVIGVMRGEHNAETLRGKPLDLLEHQHLVSEVEAGRRFVHHD